MARTQIESTGGRNAWFDLFRILFAILVLLAHAPEIRDGNRSREIFSRLTHSDLTFGQLAVDGFFLLSGFLIVQSWLYNPEPFNYLLKRLLRILPGLAVAYCVSIVLVGLFAPGVPDFFHQFNLPFTGRMVPPVLPGSYYPSVNGSLWTIAYELRCYLLVAFLGVAGIFRRPALWLILTSVLITLLAFPSLMHRIEWDPLSLLLGSPTSLIPLTAIFFAGGCLYLYERYIPFHPALATTAFLAITLSLYFHHFTEPVMVVCCGYLMLYLSRHGPAVPARLQGIPDLSYGIYLYGWPVEAIWIFSFHGSPWVAVLISIPICFTLAWVSWHVVERPALQLKHRGLSSALPTHNPATYRPKSA